MHTFNSGEDNNGAVGVVILIFNLWGSIIASAV